MDFKEILLNWYHINKRQLPWRDTRNPYFIWISEIILQQTKVEQGLSYYLKFIEVFPTIADLANANEDKVLKLWQGLGYYSRARNLHASAKYILINHKGIFPNQYDNILELKGVGEYTAAAISSFAFLLPYAVVDGNVVRVLSRFFGISESFDTAVGKKKFQLLAQNLLDKTRPAVNNQAIMEFGALQCTYKIPKCSTCPLVSGCIAYNTNSIKSFPVRIKKNKKKNRFINYFVLKNNNTVMLGKRSSGIWKGLYEFPFIEDSSQKSNLNIIKSSKWIEFFKNTNYNLESVSEVFIHKLSHQHIYAKFWKINIAKFKLKNYIFINNLEINKYPVSRLIDKFLNDNDII